MSFVLDHVLAMDRERGNLLSHSIDEHRIGAAGLSLGGITTYLLVYGDCCRDDRIKAAEVLDGLQPGVTVDGHVPLYLGHSDSDPTLPYAERVEHLRPRPTTGLVRHAPRRLPRVAVGGHRDALRPDRRTDHDRLLGRNVAAPRASIYEPGARRDGSRPFVDRAQVARDLRAIELRDVFRCQRERPRWRCSLRGE